MNLQATLSQLEKLVANDTQNPPRDQSGDGELIAFLRSAIPAEFELEVWDHGHGRVSLLARRGSPVLLFNVHLDTVPVAGGWSREPHRLGVEDERAYGLGACDIKGAAACLLSVAERTDAPMAMLFTTDEEGAQGCCVREFLDAGHGQAYQQVVVAEPTACGAVTRHRGYLSVKGRFTGVAGHSSEPRALQDNALHRAGRWLTEALDWVAAEADSGQRSCFNLGVMSGGAKSNMIADSADLHWSARLPPGSDSQAFLAKVMQFGDASEHADWTVPFLGPTLPVAGGNEAASLSFIRALGIESATPVDFWTEASLFSASGLPALVLGPGHIAQAHAADEWVALEQLHQAHDIYLSMVNHTA
jgi:acetylornithine deacetylase